MTPNNSLLKSLKGVRYIKVRGKTYDLAQDLMIDSGDLSAEFERHAEVAAFWLRMRSRELSRLRRKEEELKSLEEEMFIAYWNTFEEKKRTFSDYLIRSHVYTDVKVEDKRKEVQCVRDVYDAVNSVCVALEHRKSCLVQLGAHVRHEHENSEPLTTRRRSNNG